MNTSRERDLCVTPKLIADLHDYVSFHRYVNEKIIVLKYTVSAE